MKVVVLEACDGFAILVQDDADRDLKRTWCSQEEVDILCSLAGSVSGGGSTRTFTDKVYYGLEPLCKSTEFFEDMITIRK